MSTLFPKVERSFFERIVIRMLRTGQIPQHIAFIMDGNRRYAKKLQVEKLIGHSKGFAKLAETLSWCRDLGVTQATLYAFSIENFKRPKDEVDGLMHLFRQQFEKLNEEFDKLDSYEICFRVYGKLDLLPLDIQQSVAKLVLRTAKYRKFYLNVCLSYTAREEMANAFNDLRECVKNGIIEPEDINDFAVSNAMYSLGLREPDILLRTSGEIRLSDFLLWQTNFSYIYFVKELWPDLSIWSLFRGILEYQLQFDSIKRAREAYESKLRNDDLQLCKMRYENYLHELRKCETPKPINGFRTISTFTLDEFIRQRDRRLENCHHYIEQKRINHFIALVKDLDDPNLEFLKCNNIINNTTDNDNNNHHMKCTNDRGIFF